MTCLGIHEALRPGDNFPLGYLQYGQKMFPPEFCFPLENLRAEAPFTGASFRSDFEHISSIDCDVSAIDEMTLRIRDVDFSQVLRVSNTPGQGL